MSKEFNENNYSSKMDKSIQSFKPDIVMHLAAESHVDRSIEDPLHFINTNVVGTSILLEATLQYWRSLPVSQQENFRFLQVSTDEVYGPRIENKAAFEGDAYAPSSPYAASKASADHIAHSYYRTYELPVMIAHSTNNYGPRQFPEKLIPLMIINALNNKSLPVYGKGDNVRDWLYVLDHCDAIYTVLERGEIGQTYNVGGNNEIKNIDVIETICDILDHLIPKGNSESYKKLIHFVQDRPGHDFRYAIDASKLNSKLGWSPKESFESGLKKTIQWYINNKNWWTAILDNTYRQERLGVV